MAIIQVKALALLSKQSPISAKYRGCAGLKKVPSVWKILIHTRAFIRWEKIMDTRKLIELNAQIGSRSATRAYSDLKELVEAGEMRSAAEYYQAWTKLYDYDSRSHKIRHTKLWNLGVRAVNCFQPPFKIEFV